MHRRFIADTCLRNEPRGSRASPRRFAGPGPACRAAGPRRTIDQRTPMKVTRSTSAVRGVHGEPSPRGEPSTTGASNQASGLEIYRFGPDDLASGWVSMVWEWRGYGSPASVERILPHGMVEVSWRLSSSHRFRSGAQELEVHGATLLGARDESYCVDTSTPSHLFGFVFQPGAAGTLLRSSMAELGPWIGPLSEFSAGRALEARVGEARTAAERRHAVQAFFSNLQRPRPALEAAFLLAAWSNAEGRQRSVASLQSALGVSAPTFVDRIRRQLGLRPAQLRQVLMFREAVAALAKGDTPVIQVAHASGYCDQAHLNRAFRRHAGLTPGQFAPLMADHPFNVPEA